MNVSIGDRWQGFVDRIIKRGRCGSASEVVREGLRPVEEREAKLQALRESLDASIARGGSHTDDEAAAIVARLDKLSLDGTRQAANGGRTHPVDCGSATAGDAAAAAGTASIVTVSPPETASSSFSPAARATRPAK